MITRSVLDQFERTLRMLREAILAFPPGEWRKGDTDYLRPAGVAYHVIETIDFYTSEQSVDEVEIVSRSQTDLSSMPSGMENSTGGSIPFIFSTSLR